MELKSTNFNDGDYLAIEQVMSAPYGFGCAGGNRSPQLAWSGAPEGTRSFAVTCFDPDAPTGSGFWHWVVANLPPNVTELPAGAGDAGSGSLPAGAVTVRNDAGTREYAGPCPPQGDHPHRYFFTVFAVGADQLQVTPDTSPAVVGFQLHFNTLAKAEIVGLFKH
jgi:Raf kinase inhibitor-like YbhB/YbcL family protein